MRIFGFGQSPEEAKSEQIQKSRREQSARNLEQGGLPLPAIERLEEQASRQGAEKHFFTSDLSVSELSLVHQAGYEPLGQVMGSSIYHVGWQWTYGIGWGSQEMEVLSQAYSEVRRLALNRLQQEATILGADGVVGVRLERKRYEWGSDLIEFVAIGTAVRFAGGSSRKGAPFLSNLSGSDFFALDRAGFDPAGFAFGNCSYACVSTYNRLSWVNQEITDITQTIYQARGMAMQRMQNEASLTHAETVVGVTIESELQQIERDKAPPLTLYHFTVFGTAIRSRAGTYPFPSIQMTVSMRDEVEMGTASVDRREVSEE